MLGSEVEYDRAKVQRDIEVPTLPAHFTHLFTLHPRIHRSTCKLENGCREYEEVTPSQNRKERCEGPMPLSQNIVWPKRYKIARPKKARCYIFNTDRRSSRHHKIPGSNAAAFRVSKAEGPTPEAMLNQDDGNEHADSY